MTKRKLLTDFTTQSGQPTEAELQRPTIGRTGVDTLTIAHDNMPNQPAAPNAGIASQLTIRHHWPGVGEPER